MKKVVFSLLAFLFLAGPLVAEEQKKSDEPIVVAKAYDMLLLGVGGNSAIAPEVTFQGQPVTFQGGSVTW